MVLIPVIDLLNGQVVRAVRGDRKTYRPISSALCPSSDPATVARALCDYCASTRLYIADLDALLGGAIQVTVLRQLLTSMPDLELWLDGGFSGLAAAASLMQALHDFSDRIVPVFASESIASREALGACFADPRAGLLSLDRRDGQRLDAAGCWDALDLWPQRVIVMTLERVGSNAGPDLDTMRDLRARAPHTELIGAGGIRTAEDLALASDAGADAWLVASALHDLQLPRARA